MNQPANPPSLLWQGQTIYFLGAKSLNNISKGLVRYDYGTLLPNGQTDKVKLMQYQFAGQQIDWQRLEAENCQAPEKSVLVVHRNSRTLSARPKSVYAREWYARNIARERIKAKGKRERRKERLQEKPAHEEFVKWLETEGQL
jgi:hypothetical protein